MNLINYFRYLPHYLRKKIKGRYIIIESDDWGMERALTSDTIEWMAKKYGKENFTRWTTDALETNEDLDMLFELLDTYKNKFGSCPVITANFITQNIDYDTTDKLTFKPVSEGFNKESEDIRGKYKYGIDNGFLFPQLHGFSHYNLTSLEDYFNSDEGKEAFLKKYLPAKSTIKSNLSFLQGELCNENSESGRISEASEVFFRMFGFYSASLIPPKYVLDRNLIKVVVKSKVTMIQSSNRLTDSEKKRYLIPYFREKYGIIWSIRNARLDPYPGYDFNHEQCLESIKTAFENNSPAIIDFHRVNISGKYAPEYRQRTMTELKKLFDGIYRSWTEVKFIHSQKLNEMLWQLQAR